MIYIHIGFQKTGSTTIQKALYDNRLLLSEKGLKYADVLPEDSNKVSHYNSVRGFFSSDKQQIEHTRRFLLQFDDPSRNYLISAENLSNWPAARARPATDDYVLHKRESLAGIRSALAAHDAAIIICVRDRASYLKSLFKQHLKVTQQATRSIDQCLHQFIERELVRSNFQQEVDLWREFFPDVRVIDFDSNKGDALVEAFVRAIDLDVALNEVADQNISPDWLTLEARRILISTGAEVVRQESALEDKFNRSVEAYVSGVIQSRINGHA